MGRIFFGIAAMLFLFEALGVTIIPHPISLGLFSMALGLAVGGWIPWRKGPA